MSDNQQKEKRILLVEDDHVYRTVLFDISVPWDINVQLLYRWKSGV